MQIAKSNMDGCVDKCSLWHYKFDALLFHDDIDVKGYGKVIAMRKFFILFFIFV